MKYHMLITKHANHALEFIEGNSDLANSYSALVTLSGDGLLFEVLNGFVNLIENSDHISKKIPIPLSMLFYIFSIFGSFLSLINGFSPRYNSWRFRQWSCSHN